MINLYRISKAVLMTVLTCVVFSSETHACTGIKLVAKDSAMVHGRTLEFGVPLETSIVVIPRGFEFVGTVPEGSGLPYKAKYAAVGAIAYNNMAILDGVNEKGLAVGTFYFPGYASYGVINPENQSKALSPIDFSNWIVTQFESVDEVKKNLAKVVIAPTVMKEWGSSPPPFHYIVYDKSGRSIVIEPINGNFVVNENPLGVLTNSPDFNWHMTNLRNYINLTPFNVKALDTHGLVLSPFGQGSGMVGMPGDFTPPSRFVRAAIFSITAIPSNNAEEAVLQAFHILNQFDIPVGVVRQQVDGITHTDYTMITCVRDPQALRFYFKTYENQVIRFVDLKSFDLDAKDVKQITTSRGKGMLDISAKLGALSS